MESIYLIKTKDVTPGKDLSLSPAGTDGGGRLGAEMLSSAEELLSVGKPGGKGMR